MIGLIILIVIRSSGFLRYKERSHSGAASFGLGEGRGCGGEVRGGRV